MRRHIVAAIAMLCVLSGCSQNESIPQDDIGAVTWTLVEVNGASVDAAAMNRPATVLARFRR
jgi:hypothetical protein